MRAFPAVRQRSFGVVLSRRSSVQPCWPRRNSLGHAAAVETATLGLDHIAHEFSALSEPKDRSRLLLKYAKDLPHLPKECKTLENRVMGCTAQVWVIAELSSDGTMIYAGDSDSELTRGLCAVLVKALSGLTPDQVEDITLDDLERLSLGPLTRSRTNGFFNMLETMKKKTRAVSKEEMATFPTLCITADRATARGAFAEAQAAYLTPDMSVVNTLTGLLETKKIGVVAHFYMDPQVQGVLSAAAERWQHVNISDSLVMADGAVKMAEAGCKTIVVLGVDFMSENVRAILDEAGFADVAVYRMASDAIGCSLAEAAESKSYDNYLEEASHTPHSVHVVYINTSLKTKALAHAKVPTITCTSSNVVQTVLQAFAQVENAHVWYGPDSYMGANLAALFTSLASLHDEDVKKVHPAHTAASIKSLLPRLHYFQDGTCIVHHLFGGDVCDMVRKAYSDAYLTAHFEVPGEMFKLAMEAKKRGMGVVGSTQNILDFIAARLEDALERPIPDTLRFVLGTESGMITSIVRKVQAMLKASGRSDVAVEIVFPVSIDAITTEQTGGGTLPGGLSLIPGPASGEGCSLEGGCASCPYMKMNDLHALLTVCERVNSAGEALLEGYKPKAYVETVGGRSMASAGCEPILHMRGFQKDKRLPKALEDDIVSRNH